MPIPHLPSIRSAERRAHVALVLDAPREDDHPCARVVRHVRGRKVPVPRALGDDDLVVDVVVDHLDFVDVWVGPACGHVLFRVWGEEGPVRDLWVDVGDGAVGVYGTGDGRGGVEGGLALGPWGCGCAACG